MDWLIDHWLSMSQSIGPRSEDSSTRCAQAPAPACGPAKPHNIMRRARARAMITTSPRTPRRRAVPAHARLARLQSGVLRWATQSHDTICAARVRARSDGNITRRACAHAAMIASRANIAMITSATVAAPRISRSRAAVGASPRDRKQPLRPRPRPPAAEYDGNAIAVNTESARFRNQRDSGTSERA